MGKRHERAFQRTMNKQRNTYTLVIKLKAHKLGNNSIVGKDVDKWELSYTNNGVSIGKITLEIHVTLSSKHEDVHTLSLALLLLGRMP